MDQIAESIQTLVTESNHFFMNRQFDKAAAKSEIAYSLAVNHDNCPDITKKRIEFNLGTIYTASGNYELAKDWLDRIKSDSFTFFKLKDIAILYSRIGINLKTNPNRIKQSLDCFKLAALNYSKCQLWSDYCSIELVHAKLLADLKFLKESFQTANKILAATLYINDDIELAKIYNDLSTIYAKDINNHDNILYSKKLLLKSLNIIKSTRTTRLEPFIYQNLSAITNQLENYEKSVRYIDQAYKTLAYPDKQLATLSDLKFNEGYARFNLHQIKESINCFKESHEYALKTQNNLWESLEALATICYYVKEYSLSNENLEKALINYKIYCQNRKIPEISKIENRLLFKRKEVRNRLKGEENYDETYIENETRSEFEPSNTQSTFSGTESDDQETNVTSEWNDQTQVETERSEFDKPQENKTELPAKASPKEMTINPNLNKNETKQEKVKESESPSTNENKNLKNESIDKLPLPSNETNKDKTNVVKDNDNDDDKKEDLKPNSNDLKPSTDYLNENSSLTNTALTASSDTKLLEEFRKQIEYIDYENMTTSKEEDKNDLNQTETSIDINAPLKYIPVNEDNLDTENDKQKASNNTFTLRKEEAKLYKSFNKGSASDHPEDNSNEKSKKKTSKICTIS